MFLQFNARRAQHEAMRAGISVRSIVLVVLFACLASAALGQSSKVDATASAGCGGTTLCIDDQPGDRRFEVRVDLVTSQGGGAEGPGQSISLSGLGVTNGGVFWFYSANNPELLVKVVPGCVVNGHYWVFASAGTNVGVTMTVTDTKTGAQKVYTNPDLHAMDPIQDTSAFPCN